MICGRNSHVPHSVVVAGVLMGRWRRSSLMIGFQPLHVRTTTTVAAAARTSIFPLLSPPAAAVLLRQVSIGDRAVVQEDSIPHPQVPYRHCSSLQFFLVPCYRATFIVTWVDVVGSRILQPPTIHVDERLAKFVERRFMGCLAAHSSTRVRSATFREYYE